MSNLKLIKAHPIVLKNYLGYRECKKLGYETTVEKLDKSNPNGTEHYYVIRHHNNVIGIVGDWTVKVSNAGWTSPTTRDRINRILADNGIPYYVRQNRGWQILMKRNAHDTHDTVLASAGQLSLQFQMIAGEWQLMNAEVED